MITGFENPTTPFKKATLNLTAMFVHTPSSMALMESPADYLEAGISEGDWLLVDSSRQPLERDVVVVEHFDERFVIYWRRLRSSTKADDWDNLLVLGVITASVHHFRQPPVLPEHDNMNELDLHNLLVELEHATLFCRADGQSMMPHIFDGDLMLLERHIAPQDNDVCVLALNNDLVCKRVHLHSRQLSSDNPKFQTIVVSDSDYMRLHGVIRYSLRLHRPLLTCSD